MRSAISPICIGLGGGVLVAMTLFARRVAHLATVQRDLFEDPLDVTSAVYTVTGALFFASSNDLCTQFSYIDDPERVVVDLSDSHVWDTSTVALLDAISTKYARLGKTVEIVGLNAASASTHTMLTGRLPPH